MQLASAFPYIMYHTEIISLFIEGLHYIASSPSHLLTPSYGQNFTLLWSNDQKF